MGPGVVAWSKGSNRASPVSARVHLTEEEKLRQATSFVNGSRDRTAVMKHLTNNPGSAKFLATKLGIQPVARVTKALRELRSRGLVEPAPGPPVKGRMWFATELGKAAGLRIVQAGV